MSFLAIWTRSQRGQLSADYESVAYAGNTFIFLLKRKAHDCAYFRCAYCAKAMKLRAKRGAHKLTVPIVRAIIEKGFIDDPDNPVHPHFCIEEDGVDTSTFAAKARYVYNKVKLELLEMPMTPRQAMAYMEAEVIANFPDSVSQREIIRRFPSDKSAKRSFARRRTVAKKNFGNDFALFGDVELGLVEDILEEEIDIGRDLTDAEERLMDIPSELLSPFSSRPPWICAPGRVHLPNFFLLYRDSHLKEKPFLVFADIMGLNLLHKCSDIVCDGNSNFYPPDFAQLYTFHAVHHSLPEEAHLAAFALLPNLASQTYVKLFAILSERIGAEFGNNGLRKNWHFDNQTAAISACRAIFMADIAEGCQERTANFTQLWHNHLTVLFCDTQPDLLRFICVMREELIRASIQAERVFKRPSAMKRINLDDLGYISNYALSGGHAKPFPSMFDGRNKSCNAIVLSRHGLRSPYYCDLTIGQPMRKVTQCIPMEGEVTTTTVVLKLNENGDSPFTSHHQKMMKVSADEHDQELSPRQKEEVDAADEIAPNTNKSISASSVDHAFAFNYPSNGRFRNVGPPIFLSLVCISGNANHAF